MTDSPADRLNSVRSEIEAIDRQLLDALKRRLELSEHIVEAKTQAAVPIRDQARGDAVIHRVRHVATELGMDPHQAESLFQMLMEMSIRHQQAHLARTDATPIRIAYQGSEGSFSHMTAQRRYAGLPGGVLLHGFTTFHAAADSVRSGENDAALLPIENSTAGSINETYDILSESGLHINAEEVSRIRHSLLGLPGSEIEGIRLVRSHPQALRQCSKFLRALEEVQLEEEFDTAGAANRIRSGGDPTIAAIASAAAASVVGLEVLATDIQNESENFTRFVEIAIEAASCPADRPCKTSLLFATGHRPGDLSDVLREFAQRSINLSKLESRPIPGTPWKYRFYLDVDGNAHSGALAEALEAVKEYTAELRILGTYPVAAEATPAQ
ncbi:MAG: prephenate dehydratase [Acidobacteriota bacterium]